MARELVKRYPLDRDVPHGSARVIRTGEAELIAEVTDELLPAAAPAGEQLEVLRNVG